MIVKLLSSAARRWTVVLVALMVAVPVASCSEDAEEVPEETTSSPSTSPATVTTTTTAGALPTTTELSTTTSTTEPFPNRAVLEYFEEVRDLTVRMGELVVDMRKANNDWDNRREIPNPPSYGDTEAALEDVVDRAQDLRDGWGFIEPPPQRGLPVEHQTAWVAAGEMADAAVEALAGLRSPDTGERRRAAFAEFLVAYDRFNDAIDRIVEIIGVGGGFSQRTTTTTTAAATTTAVTTTTARATTTSTTAAATTSTTEAETTSTTEAETTSTTEAETTSTTEAETTSTTEAETTSTTEAPDTTQPSTVPPEPDVDYRVHSDVDATSQGAVRTWLTVTVDAGATKSELAQIGKRLEFEYQVAQEYQALLIDFVHFPEGIATLGTWIHAPFGDWTKAGEVEKGDYSQHETVDRTIEKDWSLLPTDAQVELYWEYTDYRETLVDSDDPPSEDEMIEMAAEKLGVTTDEIEEAIAAWETWSGA